MKKNKRIIFRISTKQDEGLQLLARLEDKTVSQYLRSLIDKELTIKSLKIKEKERE